MKFNKDIDTYNAFFELLASLGSESQQLSPRQCQQVQFEVLSQSKLCLPRGSIGTGANSKPKGFYK